MDLNKTQQSILDKHKTALVLIKAQIKSGLSVKDAKELREYLGNWFKSEKWKL